MGDGVPMPFDLPDGDEACDLGPGPLALFLSLLIVGLLCFGSVLCVAAVRYRHAVAAAGGSPSDGDSPSDDATRDVCRCLVVIFCASLVVVLSEARSGYFTVLTTDCLGAASTACHRSRYGMWVTAIVAIPIVGKWTHVAIVKVWASNFDDRAHYFGGN